MSAPTPVHIPLDQPITLSGVTYTVHNGRVMLTTEDSPELREAGRLLQAEALKAVKRYARRRAEAKRIAVTIPPLHMDFGTPTSVTETD